MKALGHRVLIKPKEIETESEGGIVLVLDERMEKAGNDIGTVTAIGDQAFVAYGDEPWCKVGDKIIYAKYGGKFVVDPVSGDDYIVINDDDCLVLLEEA